MVIPRGVKKHPSSPIYIRVNTVDAANALCTRGVVVEGTWHSCEPYADGAALKQCYRCYSYGHIAKIYRAQVRYRYYSDAYKEADYPDKNDESKSPYCRNYSAEYPAWARTCPERQE